MPTKSESTKAKRYKVQRFGFGCFHRFQGEEGVQFRTCFNHLQLPTYDGDYDY